MLILVLVDPAHDHGATVSLVTAELPGSQVLVVGSLEAALLRLRAGDIDAVVVDIPVPTSERAVSAQALRTAHPGVALLVLHSGPGEQQVLWTLAVEPHVFRGTDGQVGAAVAQAVQSLRVTQEGERHRDLAQGLLDALEASTCAVGPTGTVVVTNEAWASFCSDNAGDLDQCGEGVNYLDICDRAARSSEDHPGLDQIDALAVATGLRSVLSSSSERFEHEYPCHSQNEHRWFSVRITPCEMDAVRGALITHLDVTSIHQTQQALQHQSLHDDLTGLPNRTLMRDRLRQAVAVGQRRDQYVGVGFVDLDHFKRVNSSLGHPAGDALLVQAAWRLSHQLRAGDTLARYGADEFVVVWADLASADEVESLADRLVDTMAEPFDVLGTPVKLSVSIGVVSTEHTTTVDELIQAADAAMHEAKRLGRSRVRTFSAELRAHTSELMATEAELRRALTSSELVLHYQPVIELRTGQPVGVEALIRWQHPQRGLLPPSAFIPIAEASGLIVPVGRWALQQACQDAASMTRAAQELHMAVNLSVRQLNDNGMVDHVREALRVSGLDPGRLVLEVTESALMEDEETASRVLTELRALGTSLAIDDFGTGFSSLLYLRRYPITAIKIDRAFVSGLPSSVDDHAICSSVVSLAAAVQAVSIAEGVETHEQYATLRRMGCQLAQGFLWSRAVPLDDLRAALERCVAVPLPTAPRAARRHAPPARLDQAVRRRMAELHESGASLHTIAGALNSQDEVTPGGTRWTAAAVARYLVET